MTEHQDQAAEDLELEESEAASVAGGMGLAGAPGADPRAEIASLQAKGYVEDACTTEGTRWINHKTKHTVLVKGS
jgi:hypothetical protein